MLVKTLLAISSIVVGLAACSASGSQPVLETVDENTAEVYTADVWVDNWFSLRINGVQIAEDSVPITTERSFNSESFTLKATRPFVLGLVAKDFIENDSGLEYIGSRRQQMGDGGAVLQIRDANGLAIAVTNEDWKCLVVHRAPLNRSCAHESTPIAGKGTCGFEITEAPDGWDKADFDASAWPTATVYGEHAISPKRAYYDILWDPSAKFIWGGDLELDNTVLCRLLVE